MFATALEPCLGISESPASGTAQEPWHTGALAAKAQPNKHPTEELAALPGGWDHLRCCPASVERSYRFRIPAGAVRAKEHAVDQAHIAYFSMEIGLDPACPPTAAAWASWPATPSARPPTCSLPLVAVSLLHRRGYFYQKLDANGWQQEQPAEWAVDDFLEEMPQRASVTIEGRTVQIRCWKYEVKGVDGHVVPVYLPRCRSPGQRRLRPHADALSLRRRSTLPPLPGGDSGHRRRAHAAGAGLRPSRPLPHERRPRRPADRGAVGGTAPTRPAARPSPMKTWRPCMPSASSPRTRRSPRATTSSRWT